MIECADTKEVSLMEQGTGVEPFLVQIHPPRRSFAQNSSLQNEKPS